MTTKDWGKGIWLFAFQKSSNKHCVLSNQPWHFDNHLFIVKALDGSEQLSSITIDKAAFWIRAYDVPMVLQTEQTLNLIMKF
ncbi:hypothetical protein ACS0TY_027148 [Phlomoides rotata]